MATKAEITSQFIIETVAPVFNKYGYAGTSMSNLTEATGLTKGAIYGNFKNKEDLALQSFGYAYRRMLNVLKEHVGGGNSGLEKLYLLCNFYRNYYDFTYEYGGCPVLNVGVDSQHSVPGLQEAVNMAIQKLHLGIERMIIEGQSDGSIVAFIDAKKYATILFSIIEGAVFTSFVTKNRTNLYQTLDYMKSIVRRELAN
jgi:AcrR family transcriptional regulator